MRLRIIYLTVFFSSILLADNFYNSADSLSNLTDDSTRLNALMKTVWEKRSNEPVKAIQLAKEALALSQKTGNTSKQAQSNNFLGIIYTNIGALDIALDYHINAMRLAVEANDKVQLAYSYNNIGGIYRAKSDFTHAVENIQKAIQLFKEIKHDRGLSYCYINMGRVYKDQDYYERSIEYFDGALELAENINNREMIARILLGTAELLVQRGQYPKALKTYNDLEQLYKKIDYRKGLAEVWHALSLLNLKDKHYDDALNFALNSLQLNKEILNYEGEINNLNRIALIHLAKGNRGVGEKTLFKALELAQEQNDPSMMMSTYQTMYEFFKQTGETKNALLYHEKLYKLRDSIFSNSSMVRLGELEAAIKIEKTERENLLLQHDLEAKKQEQVYLLVITIMFLMIVVMLTIVYYHNRKTRRKLEETNIIKDKFFRIIAHDLRSPFSVLFGATELLRENYKELSEEERLQTIDAISQTVKTNFDLLENLLLWARSQSNAIKFEPVKLNVKRIISNNVDLVQSDIKRKNISVEVNSPADLSITADEQMLNSIVRNLIINAVKFTYPDGEVSITAKQIDGKVRIVVADTGKGMDKETIKDLFRLDKKTVSGGTAGEPGTGLGLIVTKEFVEKHNGTIEVESEEGKGSKFTVTLPISL